MRKNSSPITRSDLVDLLGKINESLDKRDKRSDGRLGSVEKHLKILEADVKEVIRRLDRMERVNGHMKNKIKKAGKTLLEV